MDSYKSLNYKVIGKGYPVLLLHGFLESMEMWEYLNLENEFQCILVDLPGHGDTKLNIENNVSMCSMAKEVLQIVDHLRIDKYGLVGHSMGGYVGLELIAQDVRCEKIVLLNSNFWEDSPLKKKDRSRVAEIVKKNKSLFLYEAIPNLFCSPEKHNLQVKKLIAEAQEMDTHSISAVALAMAKRKSFDDYLNQIVQQLLIIQGARDTIVPYEKMREALNSHPNIQMEVIDTGHMAHIEKTAETQKLITNFLR